MPTLQEIMLRAQALRQETAVDSISPERAGSIMYDTLAYINQMQLQGANPLLISKIYASVEAMEADSAPVSELTGEPLRPGQVVVIATGDPDDPDEGVVYRYDGTEDGASSWTAVGKIGNVEPVDSLDSDSTQLPLAAHQGKVLDGKITELGQQVNNKVEKAPGNNLVDINDIDVLLGAWISQSSGAISQAPALNTTGFIEVEPETTYFAPNNGEYTFRSVLCYDQNKTPIASSYQVNISQFTTPESAKYVRLSIYVANWDMAQLAKTSIPFEEYTPIGGYDATIREGSVTENKIANGAVTENKLANGAVKANDNIQLQFEIGSCNATGYIDSLNRARCTIFCRDVLGTAEFHVTENVSPLVWFACKNNVFSWYNGAITSVTIPLKTDYDYIVLVVQGYDNFSEHLSEIKVDCSWKETLQFLVDRKQETHYAEYENILANDKIANLQDAKKALIEDIRLLDNVKRTSTFDTVTIPLNDTQAKRLILNLHKSSGIGMAPYNNVYLPNAENDFSDVKIKDSRGNYLSYHVISRRNYDFTAPIGLPDTPIIANSHGTLFAGDTSVGLVFSTDNGQTWNEMTQFSSLVNTQAYAVHIDSEDNFFFSSPSKLYKSAYPYISAEMVLDLTDPTAYNALTGRSLSAMTDCYIFTNHFVEFGGNFYCAGYQYENWIRVYKSTDRGNTWTLTLNYVSTTEESDYQHVHNLYVDEINSPNAIYAGCDRAGHVFKTTDGVNWTDIKTADWQNSTDYGVICAGDGFRLLGGETSIKGGNSIQRTTDDVSLRSVLANGHGFYMAAKLGSVILAGAVASEQHRMSGIYESRDNGLSWELVYLIPYINAGGASDGFRYICPVRINGVDVVYAGCQGYDNNLIIRQGQYFSQIIVDVPAGRSQITIESGFLKGNIGEIFNEQNEQGMIVMPLNEHQDFVLERIKKQVFGGDYTWEENGCNFGDIVPRINPTIDNFSFRLVNGFKGFDIGSLTLSGGFHIGFWARLAANTNWTLLSINGQNLLIINHQLRINDWQKIVSFSYPLTNGSMNRFDINFASDGTLSVFVNGLQISTSLNGAEILQNGQAKILIGNTIETAVPIQHFVITRNLVTLDDAKRYYLGLLNDNHQPLTN